MNRTNISVALLVAGGLVVAACGGGDDDASPTTPQPTTAPAVATTVEPTIPESTSPPVTTVPPITTTTIPDVPRLPLTGEPISDDSEIPDRPALAVKIPNNPGAWPHNGLNRADVVFETIINDDITRFIAVFHNDDVETLGPIRSGRSQDVNLLESLDHPLFAWSGGNPGVTRVIRDSDLVDLSAIHTSGYYRRSGRGGSPHNLFSSTEALWVHSPDDAVAPPQIFNYLREGETLDGPEASTIEITLDSIDARWEYDAETGQYFRWQEGGKHNTEEYGQVWADNVVVMMTDYKRSWIDGSPDGQSLGTNPVYVFTGGTVQEGVWLRFQPEDRFGFFDNLEDLNELSLQPGHTWVELPRNSDENLTWS